MKIRCKIIRYLFFLTLTLLLTAEPFQNNATANEPEAIKTDTLKTGQGEKKGFNAGEMILEHITDNHEWHITTIGSTDIAVPLPIILYHKGKLDIFMSGKFHHGEESYKGYKLELEGKHKNKIICVKEDGVTPNEEAGLPLDLSITKTVASVIISIILIILIFTSVARSYKKNTGKPPRGLQSLLEPVIIFIRDDIARSSIGEKKYEKFMPFLLTVFFFILINNLMGLIPFFPGGVNVTGNIAVTLTLALFTFIITNFSGNKSYWMHVFNTPGVPWWLKIPLPLMPIIELVGMITKPFVLTVRLFANITAGHIIALGFMSLIFIFGNLHGTPHTGMGLGVSVLSVLFAVFMSMLEILVAFLQAYVFTLLSALYFGMAVEEHEHPHELEQVH